MNEQLHAKEDLLSQLRELRHTIDVLTSMQDEQGRQIRSLEERENLLRSTLESTADGILVVNSKREVIHWNKKYAELWHVPGEILETGNSTKLVDYVMDQMEDPHAFVSKTAALYETEGIVFDTLLFKDGRMYERYSLPLIVNGEANGRIWSFRDVTHRKKMEEALHTAYDELEKRVQERTAELAHTNEELQIEIAERRHAEKERRTSEKKYRTLFENTGTAKIIIEEDTTISLVNAEFEKLSGYTREELQGKKVWMDFVHTQDREDMKGQHELRRISPENALRNYEFRFIDKLRQVKDIFCTISMIPGTRQSLAALTDITERNISERQVAERQRYLERVLAAAPDAIITLDPRHHVVEWNPGAERLFGFSPAETIGKELDDLITDRRTHAEANGFTMRVLSGQEVRPTETIRYGKDKKPLRVIASGTPIMMGDELIGVVAIYRDISHIRKAEEALRESQERYKNLVENVDELIWEIDTHGIISYVSTKVQDITGYEPREIIGTSFFDFLRKEALEQNRNVFKKSIVEKKLLSTLELAAIHKDGHIILLETSASPFFDREGNLSGFRGVSRDITERKILEGQFQQAQKMEAIGTLAGGIAHDFNNLLMGIQGRASLMLMDLDPSHPHYEHLLQQEEIVKSGANLTKQLLGFARGGKYEVRATDLNSVITKSADMFGRTKKEITIHYKLQEGVWPTEVDRGQIEQVLLNIYVNAWQAMPDGGDLYLETRNMNINDEGVRPFSVKAGNYIRVSITDTGIGMDEHTRQHIFDPFFTTKEMGRGTGLGLASVYGIVKNHDGFITVDSEKGHGATFTLYFPASTTPKEEECTPVQQDTMIKGTGTVLFIDDESMILDVGSSILKSLGYEVITAKEGMEGIALFKEHSDTIDLVILDMVMPGMTGGEVFDQLKLLNSGVKVLLASGYSLEGQASEIMARGCRGFIQKPFGIESLSHSIREILQE